ncbi:hypothetical protein ACKKBF_B40235 [Auxenochlorella protothecoides x Auxenochlorella symbiontica]
MRARPMFFREKSTPRPLWRSTPSGAQVHWRRISKSVFSGNPSRNSVNRLWDETVALKAIARLQWDKRWSRDHFCDIICLGFSKLQGLLTCWSKMPVTQCGDRSWGTLLLDFVKEY